MLYWLIILQNYTVMSLATLNLTLIYLWAILELILTIKKRSSSKGRQDRSSLRAIWLALLIGLLAANWIETYHPLGVFSHTIWIQVIALLALLVGFIIRYVAIYTLKRFFTFDVHVEQNHQLIQSGLYHWIRHPAYLGTLLIIAGIGLQFDNLGSWSVLMVFAIGVHLYRIQVEEAILLKHFGIPYEKYQRQSWRLLPFIY